MERTKEQIIEALENIEGVENIEYYTLINNYGATFVKNGYNIDLRRWANCYGVDAGWGISTSFENCKKLPKLEYEHTFEGSIKAIKEQI